MAKVMSHRQRMEEHIKKAIDDCSLWFVYENLGVDKEGRWKRRFHALQNPFPNVAEAVPVWTSMSLAILSLSRMRDTDFFDTAGMIVGTFGRPGCGYEKRQADMLTFLADSMMPDCLMFNWDGKTDPQKGVARAARTQIRGLIFGAPQYLDRGPNASRLLLPPSE